MPITKLSVYLKQRRLQIKKTQSQISKEIGLSSPQFISNIERGIACVPIDKFDKFSSAYEISAKKLAELVTDKLTKTVLEKANLSVEPNRETDPFIAEFTDVYTVQDEENKLLIRKMFRKMTNTESKGPGRPSKA